MMLADAAAYIQKSVKLGYTSSGNPLHIVCGLSIPEVIIVITLYRPDPTEWLAGWKTRR